MSWNRVKIDKADTMFSKYMRLKVGKCECCGKVDGLQVHHFITRRKESTRYFENNIIVLCCGCHRKFHDSPHMQVEFMIKRLGQERYDALVIR